MIVIKHRLVSRYRYKLVAITFTAHLFSITPTSLPTCFPYNQRKLGLSKQAVRGLLTFDDVILWIFTNDKLTGPDWK